MDSVRQLRSDYWFMLAVLGIEDGPAGYVPDAPPTIRAWAAPGTTFVSGFNSLLNICYTYIGHILIPSYMDDMKRPEDFRKSLYVVTFLEVLVYTLGGAIGYYYIGDQYMTSPAYGSLMEPYTKVRSRFSAKNGHELRYFASIRLLPHSLFQLWWLWVYYTAT